MELENIIKHLDNYSKIWNTLKENEKETLQTLLNVEATKHEHIGYLKAIITAEEAYKTKPYDYEILLLKEAKHMLQQGNRIICLNYYTNELIDLNHTSEHNKQQLLTEVKNIFYRVK